MILSLECFTYTDIDDDSEFDEILAEILVEEEVRKVQYSTDSSSNKKVKKTKKKKPTSKKTEL